MKSDMRAVSEELLAALAAHRPAVPDDHWATIETFCAVALRVMAKTNPSKLIRESKTVEISTLIGRSVVP